MEPAQGTIVPSWLRWPPNCCETCTGWSKELEWFGTCNQSGSVNCGDKTDARFRCQDFIRKPDEPTPSGSPVAKSPSD